MAKVSRRSLLLGGVGALALTLSPQSLSSRVDSAAADVVQRAHAIRGTTLEAAAAPVGRAGYRRLTDGPGYPLIVREELAAAASDRDSRRTGLAAFVQLTDLHIVDAQSPARFEFLGVHNGSAFRPHEALGTHGAARLIARIDAVGVGPFTGRPFDCVVSTGDNTDNGEGIELDWYLTALNGGAITANTGSRSHWEGVQSSGGHDYYNPEDGVADRYKTSGFPELPGFFSRAVAAHSSPGLRAPWYAVIGNHDDSVTGSVPNLHGAWDDVYTGAVKFTGFVSDAANAALRTMWTSSATSEAAIATLPKLVDPPALRLDWAVTADERRRPFTKREYLAAHLDPANAGPGPVGHGFGPDELAAERAYYDFELAPGVVGISLDSTNPAGLSHGSLDDRQFRWLRGRLAAHADAYVIVFSHHTSSSMDSPLPDPDRPDQPRHSGEEVVALLNDHPTVLAWVNGHTHANRITPRPGRSAQHGFWEINTASHIDFPQHARVIEVGSNGDGTLSLFTTLIESDAPYQADYDDLSQPALASLYRELAYNDPHAAPAHAGAAADRNTELLLADPLA